MLCFEKIYVLTVLVIPITNFPFLKMLFSLSLLSLLLLSWLRKKKVYWNETLYLSYISNSFDCSIISKVFTVLQSTYRDFAEENQSWTIITVKLFISIKYLIYTNCKGENQGERRENARCVQGGFEMLAEGVN